MSTHEGVPSYAELRFHCMQLKKLEQAKIKLELQISAVERGGLNTEVIMPAMHGAVAMLNKPLGRMRSELLGFVEGSRLAAWIEGNPGLGPSVVLGIGLMPPLDPGWIPDPEKDPPNYMLGVRACYKYCGLDVRDGRAPKREKGKFLGYDAYLKSVWIYRVGKSIEYQSTDGPSDYRALYDRRKAHTLIAHPPMLEIGECDQCDAARRSTQVKRAEHEYERERKALSGDCAGEGGLHWSDGHRRLDALRYTAKQVLKDAWLVANGKLPSVAHRAIDSQKPVASSAAAV